MQNGYLGGCYIFSNTILCFRWSPTSPVHLSFMIFAGFLWRGVSFFLWLISKKLNHKNIYFIWKISALSVLLQLWQRADWSNLILNLLQGFIRLDMSEFQERHEVSKWALKGAASNLIQKKWSFWYVRVGAQQNNRSCYKLCIKLQVNCQKATLIECCGLGRVLPSLVLPLRHSKPGASHSLPASPVPPHSSGLERTGGSKGKGRQLK